MLIDIMQRRILFKGVLKKHILILTIYIKSLNYKLLTLNFYLITLSSAT